MKIRLVGEALVRPNVNPGMAGEANATAPKIGCAEVRVRMNDPVAENVLPAKANVIAFAERSTDALRPDDTQLSRLGPTQKPNSGPAPTTADPNDPKGLIVVDPVTAVEPLTVLPTKLCTLMVDALAERASAIADTNVIAKMNPLVFIAFSILTVGPTVPGVTRKS